MMISVKLKIQLNMIAVVPDALYASETWKKTNRLSQRLDAFHQRCLRILRTMWKDHISNDTTLERAAVSALSEIVAKRRIRFAGHILRLPEQHAVSTVMHWVLEDGRHMRGQPRTRWRQTFTQDVQAVGITWDKAKDMARDRENRKLLAAQYSGWSRRN